MCGKPVVTLLNPPSPEIVIRDNFCSKVSQAAYINHPIDLVMQSGFLKSEYSLFVVDAVVEHLSTTTCIARLKQINPIAIYALTGSVSWRSDRLFFKRLKSELPDVRLVVSGDIFLENPGDRLEEAPEIDAVLTDFTTPVLRRYLSGKDLSGPGLIIRNSVEKPNSRATKAAGAVFTVPVPRHDLFVHLKYRYPFVRKRPFATVMTEYGCPFHCSFCVMGTLGHKFRPVANVMDELAFIGELGIRDVFFLDQTFGSDRARNLALCDALAHATPSRRWLCFSRVDVLDEEMMYRMRSAGCHTIIFGVESADEGLLRRYRKGYTTEQIRRTFSSARRLGIRTVATFILGLPGETWDTALKTIAFARSLECDYASLNVAVPRMGTEMRAAALAEGHIEKNLIEFDQSGGRVVMETEQLSREQLAELKRRAVKELYLRPSYIFKRLRTLKSWDEFRIQATEGFHLIKRYLTAHHD